MSPLDSKEIKPINPKGNQPWIFIERTDAAFEAPILWPTDAKSWLIGEKTLMLGKIKGRRRRSWQRMKWLDVSLTQQTWMIKLWETVKDRKAWHAAAHGITESDVTSIRTTTIRTQISAPPIFGHSTGHWDLSSLTKDGNFAPRSGSSESEPLGRQEVPTALHFYIHNLKPYILF